MYTDDTKLYTNQDNFSKEYLKKAIKNNLECLNTLITTVQLLSLNVSKTKLMIFRKRKQIVAPKLNVNNVEIVEAVTYNFYSFICLIYDMDRLY